MKIDYGGLIPATILPMQDGGSVDEPALRRYLTHVAGQGVQALAVYVDTGEGPHLWHQERVRVLEVAVDEVGDRVPVVAGLGAQLPRRLPRPSSLRPPAQPWPASLLTRRTART